MPTIVIDASHDTYWAKVGAIPTGAMDGAGDFDEVVVQLVVDEVGTAFSTPPDPVPCLLNTGPGQDPNTGPDDIIRVSVIHEFLDTDGLGWAQCDHIGDDKLGTVKHTDGAIPDGWIEQDPDLFIISTDGTPAVGVTGGQALHGGGTNDHTDHTTQNIADTGSGVMVATAATHSETDNQPPWVALTRIKRVKRT